MEKETKPTPEEIKGSAEWNERNKFTFFVSFWEAVKEADEHTQALFFRAICEFALYEKEPNFTEFWQRAIWNALKPNIVSGWIKYRNGLLAKCSDNIGGQKGNDNAKKGRYDKRRGADVSIPNAPEQKTVF